MAGLAGWPIRSRTTVASGNTRGGDTFPARFAADGDRTFSPAQSVQVQAREADLIASVRVASLYGSSAEGGQADRYRFETLTPCGLSTRAPLRP